MIAARAPAVAAVLVSLALGLTAWTWRTRAVGGSDSACYALMTKAYVDGQWQPDSPLAREAPWPDATRVAAPGGFLPSAARAGAAVPVCAPGYGLLVAPLALVAGLDAVHLVPPAAAALLAGRVVTTGLLIGLALLVRPNLAPAAVAAVLSCGALAARGGAVGRLRRAVTVMAVASLAALPGVVAVIALNVSLYGSALQSGYGELGVLFAWTHVPVNLAQYGRTWLATSTPLVLLALAAPLAVSAPARVPAWLLTALAAALSVVYLAYRPFPEWWYLRFLLPAVVISIVLAVSALSALATRAGGHAGAVLAALAVAAAAVSTAQTNEARDALGLAALEARFPLTSEVVATRLPPDAVLVTGWGSGAVRFQPGREVVMWDALDPAWLDRALTWLADHGHSPAIALESWEQDTFRARFAGKTFGALDWPPRYDLDRRVFVFLPADRARYQAGERIATERVFAARPRR